MDIRMLTTADATAYRALRLEALLKNPEAFLTTADDFSRRTLQQVEEQLVPTADHFTLGAFKGDEQSLLGTITFVRGKPAKIHHIGDVVGMYVTPAARGNGTGTKLMQALISRARQMECLSQLKLSVVADNAAAVQLYQSAGFEQFGYERMALKAGAQCWDELHMVLFLDGESGLAPFAHRKRGFSHVTLDIHNLETSLRFYVEVLGFTLVHRGRRDAYLSYGSAWLCLQERPDLGASSAQVGMNHVALYVEQEDFTRAVTALHTTNTTIVRGPIERGGGMSVNFLDPDGIQLELYTGTLADRMKVWK